MAIDDKYTIDNLISAAADQKPTDFQDAFNSLMLDKINAKIQDVRHHLAQNVFNEPAEYSAEEDTEE